LPAGRQVKNLKLKIMSDISPVKARAHKYVGVYVAIILFVMSFGLGVLVGQGWMNKNASTTGGNVASFLNLNSSAGRPDSAEFDEFWTVWDKIKEKYVKSGTVKDQDLVYGAIAGLVYSLGDPYSMYMPPKAAEEFSKSLSGEFEGIGAEIGVKNNQLVVVAPLPDTPADRAGLRAGDKILAIDKIDTSGMDTNTAVMKIRGVAGTTVVLTITRDGVLKAKEFPIVRAQINVPSVLYLDKPGNVAYLRVMQFNENVVSDFEKYVNKIKKDGKTGIILDLRNNPGGYLDAAVAMASEWVKTGPVVSERFSSTTINIHDTIGKHRLAGIKTVVLINGGSASASEIVAGALQDTKTATIVGEKSFGKGSVQEYEPFADGSALKLTVAEWFTPNNKNINELGITPDVEVKEDSEKEKVGEDVMISKALELLK